MKNVYLHIICYLVFSWSVKAQDTTFLDVIQLETSSVTLVDIGNTQSISDSINIAQLSGKPLSELLQNSSPIFIKSYGTSSLQTVSYRGTNASHTNLVWHGISLNNLSLGLSDFGNIPVTFNSQIQLISGASATRYGSSSIGGTLVLDQNKSASNQLQVQHQMGSYGFVSNQLGLQIGNSTLKWNSYFSNSTAQNDFEFTNFKILRHPQQRLQNAALNQWHKLDDIYWQFHSSNSLSLHTWFSKSHREIPGSMASMPNYAEQFDHSRKAVLLWTLSPSARQKLESRIYMNNDGIKYQDDEIDLVSNLQTHTLGFSQNWRQLFMEKANYQLSYSLNHTLEKQRVNSGNFGTKSEWLYSPFASTEIQLFQLNLSAQIRLRQEWRTQINVPIIPSLGVSWKYKTSALNFSLGKHFRVPTFNDRYWTPGGNLGLKPESGYSSQLNFTQHLLKEVLRLSASIYYLDVKDWIIWAPTSSGYWMPNNLQHVISKGIDIENRLYSRIGPSFSIHNTQVLTLNNTEQANKPGFQLIYAPRWQFKQSLRFTYKSFEVYHSFNIVGPRYLNSTNSSYLNTQSLHQMGIGVDLPGKYKSQLQFRCENIFDIKSFGVQGQVQARRQFFIRINFKLINKHHEIKPETR